MSDQSSAQPLSRTLRLAIIRASLGIGLYAGALGVSFGAVSGGAGFSIWQTMVLSLVMFSGGSQFAFVGAGALGSAWSAMSVALLLAVRNSFYGVKLADTLAPLGWRRLWVAQLVIDETAAMSMAQRERGAARYAFYATGFILFVLWQAGSLAGVLIGRGIDTSTFGLDVAAAAAFLALLWPALTTWRARLVAIISGVVAFALIPIAPAGIPVIATAVVALAAGLTGPVPVRSSQIKPTEPASIEPVTAELHQPADAVGEQQ